MEYKTFKTKAVVLGEKEFTGQDKIFSVFTKNYGKIEILAKSVRKIEAKLQGGLQILNHLSLEFVKGKNFNIITDAIIKNEFLEIKSSAIKFRAYSYICNLLDKLVKGEEKDERIWYLLLETLSQVSQLPVTSYQLPVTVRYFEWNLLSCLGFKPELYFCLNCQEKIQKGNFFFSSRDGGILCQKCKIQKDKSLSKGQKTTPHIKEVSKDAIKILRLILNQNQKILRRIKTNPALLEELKELSKMFLQYIAEEELSVVL